MRSECQGRDENNENQENAFFAFRKNSGDSQVSFPFCFEELVVIPRVSGPRRGPNVFTFLRFKSNDSTTARAPSAGIIYPDNPGTRRQACRTPTAPAQSSL